MEVDNNFCKTPATRAKKTHKAKLVHLYRFKWLLKLFIVAQETLYLIVLVSKITESQSQLKPCFHRIEVVSHKISMFKLCLYKLLVQPVQSYVQTRTDGI